MKAMTLGILFGILAAMFIGNVKAHDAEHPEYNDWFAGLMQPDVPSASCCGTADAYWCDDYYAGKVGTTREGMAFCKITDDREDAPLHRPHVDVGTEIEIPSYKLKYDRGNPTGHAVVFLSRGGMVWCFVQASGI